VKELVQDLGGRHVMYAILACVTLLIMWTLERRNKNAASTFSFDDLLTDNGKTSKPAAVMFGAFALSVWLMVFLAVNDKMTEGYFGAFLAAWVAPSVAKIIKGDPPGTVTSVISTSTTVEK
jgi:hypothetical protein